MFVCAVGVYWQETERRQTATNNSDAIFMLNNYRMQSCGGNLSHNLCCKIQ